MESPEQWRYCERMQRARVVRGTERDAAAIRDQHDAVERRPAPRPGIQPGKLPFGPDFEVELSDIDELLREIEQITPN